MRANRRQVKVMVLSFFAMLLPLLASAKVKINGIYYNLDDYTKQVEVTFPDDYRYTYYGSITIPATVTHEGVQYSVTSIGKKAFYECSSLKSVNIPESVTSIGDYAFYRCSSLTSITIPEGVTSIGGSAFRECSSLKSVNIPEGVTSIGDYTFCECSKLTSITIPEGVTSIGYNAFMNCSSLTTNITIPVGVTRISSYAFAGCNNLTSITVPNNSKLTSIEDGAFQRCSSLTTINIPGGVTSIGCEAFNECHNLKSVNIPENSQLKSIRWLAFQNCSNLTNINVPKGVTSIEWGTFANCNNLTAITISDGVTSIEEGAFSGCESLTALVLPKSLMNIGPRAFGYCTKLLDVYCYAETVPSTHSNAFDGSYPENATLHVPVNAINAYKSTAPWSSFGKFETLDAVEDIVASGTCGANLTWKLTEEYELVIEGTGEMSNYSIEMDVPWYEYRKSIKKVTIHEGVTSIGNRTFLGYSELTTITIPEGVTNIGYQAFFSCSGLTTITIPKSVTSIGQYAFTGFTGELVVNCNIPNGSMYRIGTLNGNFRKVTIGEGVTTIGSCAFSNGTGDGGPDSIIISSTVTSIGEQAFYNCGGLSSIIISENSQLTSIGRNAFQNCTGLTSITIPNGVKTIPYYAFQGCTGLTSINMPEQMTSIGAFAFEGCCNLSSITFPKNSQLTEIGTCAFKDCNKLSTITIPESVTSIGNSVFNGCSSLTNIVIPQESQLTSIGWSACDNCHSLTEIVLPKNIRDIGGNVFNNCTKLRNIYSYMKDMPNMESPNLGEGIDCENITLHVPLISLSKYKDTTPWNSLKLKTHEIATTSITLSHTMLDMTEGEISKLNVSVNPNEAWDKSVSWSSSNEAIVKIDSIGRVVAISSGSAIITATANDGSGVSASCEVTVSPAKYVLTAYIDGEVFTTDTLARGESFNLIEPHKEGYTFSGWGEAPETMPNHDLNLYATFTPNKYLVAFKIGDEVIASDSLEYGAAIIAPEAPEKEGYTFEGWGEIPKTVPACDVIIKGKYSANEYLLSFIIDGSLYEMRRVKCNEEITSPDIAEKEGYTLVWENWIDKMPAKDYSIRGKHVAKVYTITYVVDDEIVQIDSVAYGTAITTPEEPTKEGYTFSGWREVPKTMPAKDVTISGIFTINKYLVTFKIGDEVIASDSLEYMSAIVVPEAPEKEGHTFESWGEVAKEVPAHDVTYEGSYSVNSYLLTYTVDGEVVKSDSVAYGTAITALVEPEKEGYTFSGWIGLPETMPAKDATISGVFTINKYLVTFKIGDEVIASDSLEYDAFVIVPEAPEKEGYTFDGWGDVEKDVPAHDLTYEGSYTVNTYKVYYYVGDELVHTAEVAYGEAIPEYVYEPTEEGYTFVGWVGETYDTMPAHDLTYEGSYTVNTYNVYYYVGDELVHTAEVAYGEAIPEYVYEPTEEGYTFLGWIGDTYETMPAHDVTYIANIDDAIEELTIDKSQLTIYDLQGRKVLNTENLKGGIYIINGKQVLIK